jgi:hypothetical protein
MLGGAERVEEALLNCFANAYRNPLKFPDPHLRRVRPVLLADDAPPGESVRGVPSVPLIMDRRRCEDSLDLPRNYGSVLRHSIVDGNEYTRRRGNSVVCCRDGLVPVAHRREDHIELILAREH